MITTTSPPDQATLPGVAIEPAIVQPAPTGEPLTVAALDRRTKLMARVAQELVNADAQLRLNGNRGKLKIVLTLEVEAQGFARHIGVSVETKAAKLTRWETFLDATTTEAGELTVNAEPAKPKRTRKKKGAEVEAADEPEPTPTGIPADEFNGEA